MTRRYNYLVSLILVFIIPSIITGYFVIPFISLTQLAVFVLAVTAAGSLWDLWATRHGKRDPVWIWQFNRRDTIGVFILGLPLEEYLFYVFSSVYVIFIWQSISMAIATGSMLFWLLPPAIALWTLLSVSVPFKLSPKRDRIIG